LVNYIKFIEFKKEKINILNIKGNNDSNCGIGMIENYFKFEYKEYIKSNEEFLIDEENFSLIRNIYQNIFIFKGLKKNYLNKLEEKKNSGEFDSENFETIKNLKIKENYYEILSDLDNKDVISSHKIQTLDLFYDKHKLF